NSLRPDDSVNLALTGACTASLARGGAVCPNFDNLVFTVARPTPTGITRVRCTKFTAVARQPFAGRRIILDYFLVRVGVFFAGDTEALVLHRLQLTPTIVVVPHLFDDRTILLQDRSLEGTRLIGGVAELDDVSLASGRPPTGGFQAVVALYRLPFEQDPHVLLRNVNSTEPVLVKTIARSVSERQLPITLIYLGIVH